MISTPDDLPSDLASALAALRAEREERLRVETERDIAQVQASKWQAEAANARAELSDTEARIAHLERERSANAFCPEGYSGESYVTNDSLVT